MLFCTIAARVFIRIVFTFQHDLLTQDTGVVMRGLIVYIAPTLVAASVVSCLVFVSIFTTSVHHTGLLLTFVLEVQIPSFFVELSYLFLHFP